MILMREGSVFSWWQSAAIFDFYGTKEVSDGQKEGEGGGNKYFCLSLPPLPLSTLTLHQTWLVEKTIVSFF